MVADVLPADQSTIFRGVRVMGGQGQQVPRTITLKELGLTGEAWMPLSISVAVFLVAALSGLLVTMPAWYVLGIGRSFLPEFLMPVTAFALLLITTGGLTQAWALATIGFLTLWEVLGRKTTFATVRLFSGVSVVIIWFWVAPFVHIYAVPRAELEAKVLAQNPALHYALYTFHRYNDTMHFIFAVAVLALLWGCGDRLLRSRVAQVLTLVLLWLTFFSLSLTIGLHSATVRLTAG
jgi:hypothetical protein